MNEDLMKYYNQKYSVFETYAVQAEKRGDWERIEVYIKGTGVLLGDIWLNKNKPYEKKRGTATGGKRAYTRLHTKKLQECMASWGTKGFMMDIERFIQWNTGLLINKRTGKALDVKSMAKLLNVSHATTWRHFKDAMKHSLILEQDDGYHVNPLFMAKGLKDY